MVSQHIWFLTLTTTYPLLSWLVLSLSLFHNCNQVLKCFHHLFFLFDSDVAILPKELFSGSVLLDWIVVQFFGPKQITNIRSCKFNLSNVHSHVTFEQRRLEGNWRVIFDYRESRVPNLDIYGTIFILRLKLFYNISHKIIH